MKNKKGFTLVELLAVIAILAILVIIALPNVLKMFRNAKQNTFITEVQNLVRSAETKYVTGSMANENNTCFDSKTNPLDMTGRDNLIYKIKLSDRGKVTEVSVADDDYQLIIENENGINIADIGNTYKVEPINEDTTIVSCDNTALKGEYVDKKLIIKNDNEEIQSIQMGKNTTTTIDKESDLSLITCNNGIEISEENNQIKLDNVLINNSVCTFSNDLKNTINNLDDTQNNIFLINDLNLEEQVTINKPLAIEMNGKSINSILTSPLITNNSNLIIKNSSEVESSITSNNVIINNIENAELNIEKINIIFKEPGGTGAIANHGKLIVKNSYIKGPYGISHNDTNTATFDIYDSEIIGTVYNGINLNSNCASSGNIHSSTITGELDAIDVDSNGIVNIYSGTFTGKTSTGIYNHTIGTINISNANINSNKWGLINNGEGTINICSGEISGLTYDILNVSTGIVNYTSKVTLKNSKTSGTNINLTDGITCN